MDVSIKRVYEPAEPGDGFRILVDRLWPRGMKKVDLSFDLWAKELAPSTEARKEFGHRPENFEAFRARYTAELDARPEAVEQAHRLAALQEPVTLLYAAKDPRINHAVILAAWLERF
ncbi:DUF488 domain-containing protein [Curtanaerobium respiraculi]|uniref:DUF488 domain-containing protein n=1 Tax=Curtanaerobium respiraculi TaxID=2949669 RepID=UPI0024B3B3B6|nr:DUF488 family protein [Curtanaerobium respiraculi]